MKTTYKIGELARLTGVTVRALRLYEKMDLIQPSSRTESGYRLYVRSQIEAVAKIKAMKGLGLSLSEIKELKMEIEPTNEILSKREQSIQKQIIDLQSQLTLVRGRMQGVPNQKVLEFESREKKEERTVKVRGIQSQMMLSIDFGGMRAAVVGSGKNTEIAEKIRSLASGMQVETFSETELDIFKTLAATKGFDRVVISEISLGDSVLRDQYLAAFRSEHFPSVVVFNADDRASVELASYPDVQRGKIYYFSKNIGLLDQILKIGGVVGDGESLKAYRYQTKDSGPLMLKYKSVLSQSEETSLLAAMTLLLDEALDC